jgi:hypothetical protein
MEEKFIREKYLIYKGEGLLRYSKMSVVLPPLCYWYENQKRVAENDISKTSKTT